MNIEEISRIIINEGHHEVTVDFINNKIKSGWINYHGILLKYWRDFQNIIKSRICPKCGRIYINGPNFSKHLTSVHSLTKLDYMLLCDNISIPPKCSNSECNNRVGLKSCFEWNTYCSLKCAQQINLVINNPQRKIGPDGLSGAQRQVINGTCNFLNKNLKRNAIGQSLNHIKGHDTLEKLYGVRSTSFGYSKKHPSWVSDDTINNKNKKIRDYKSKWAYELRDRLVQQGNDGLWHSIGESYIIKKLIEYGFNVITNKIIHPDIPNVSRSIYPDGFIENLNLVIECDGDFKNPKDNIIAYNRMMLKRFIYDKLKINHVSFNSSCIEDAIIEMSNKQQVLNKIQASIKYLSSTTRS